MKKLNRALALLMLLSLVFAGAPQLTAKAAAANGTVSIEGIEKSDTVELYLICRYDESTSAFEWASAVSTWLNKPENEYSTLTPAKLFRLSKETQKTFCQSLLLSLKNDSTGAASLNGKTFLAREEDNNVSLVPGVYVLLPKGIQRIYEIKWFELNPGEEKTIEYTDSDYAIPAISTSVSNITEDRGDAGFSEDSYPLTYLSDEVQVSADIDIPEYNDMYSEGKTIVNLALVIPYGMDLVEDSLELTSDDSAPLPATAYSKQQLMNGDLYMNQQQEPLFIGQGSYFYELSGSPLVGPEATVEDGLEAYNNAHGSSYTLDPTVVETVEEYDEAKASAEDESQDESDLIEADDIAGAEVDKTNWIITRKNNTFLILSLNSVSDYRHLNVAYKASKNDKSSDTGYYPFASELLYSVSPLDGNAKGQLLEEAIASSYGIRITACMGYADTYTKTLEDILSHNPRMDQDVFTLYVKSGEFDGDISSQSEDEPDDENESEAEAQSDEVVEKRLLYDQTQDRTYEYTLVTRLETDEEGVVTIGGIEPQEYLVVQTEMSPGYALSVQSLLIEEGDWTNEVAMEGNSLFDVLWLDYETVYLPATGSTDAENMRVTGSLILLGLALVFARRYRKFVTTL